MKKTVLPFKNIRIFVFLQFMNIIFSLNSVLGKLASVSWDKNGLLSPKTVLLISLSICTLAGYAFLWQSVLSKVDLVVAYMSKGLVIFWGLLWAFLLFDEHINLYNILGAVIIFLGTLLVNYHEK